jgi:hypothetical protein
MSECLHCDINDLVQQHMESSQTVDVVDLAAKMAESLVDLILSVEPEEDRAKLLAHTIAHLGDLYIQKSGAGEGETAH